MRRHAGPDRRRLYHPKGARFDFTELPGSDELDWLSRHDGLQYFRLNPLGAFCLELADTHDPGTTAERASLTVFPDMRVRTEEALSADERLPDALRAALLAFRFLPCAHAVLDRVTQRARFFRSSISSNPSIDAPPAPGP